MVDMSFLATLFEVPEAWLHRWTINDEGDLGYQDELPHSLRAKLNKQDAHDDHGHKKKDVHEMSRTELAGIAATCNAKELKLVLRKGSDAALINALANAAISADLIVDMIEKSSPSAAVLTSLGRTRYAKVPPVAAAICKNLKTPLYLARTLIGRCQKQDLKAILKTPGLSPSLKMAARDKMTRKK